jgi:hypothetical protein
LEHLPFKLVKRGVRSDWYMNVKHLIHSLVMCLPSSRWHFNHIGGQHCQWKAVHVDLCCTHNTSVRILMCQHLLWHETCISCLKNQWFSYLFDRARIPGLWGKQYADCATILIVRHTCQKYFFTEKQNSFKNQTSNIVADSVHLVFLKKKRINEFTRYLLDLFLESKIPFDFKIRV